MTSPLLTVSSSIHGVFHSTAFMVAWNFASFLAVVFWLGLGFWVYRDARRRIGNPLLVGAATLLGLVVPYLGPVLYTLFRPAETLVEVRSRQVELRLLEQQLDRAHRSCPICSATPGSDFLVCPVCTTRLRKACMNCAAPLELLWQMCPYCATDTEPAQPDLNAALSTQARAIALQSEQRAQNARSAHEPRIAQT